MKDQTETNDDILTKIYSNQMILRDDNNVDHEDNVNTITTAVDTLSIADKMCIAAAIAFIVLIVIVVVKITIS